MDPREASTVKPCRALPAFQTDELDSVRQAFKNCETHHLRQFWREQPETDLAPAQVSAGWRGETIFAFAELIDHDIFSRADKNNARLWELGDVFEIFLQPEGQKSYFEFHTAPNGHWLQLRFPEIGAVDRARATGSCEEFLVRGEQVLKTTIWLQPETNRWLVLAQIPAKKICETPAPLAGSRWKFSFCRYDYTRGREKPVISSTSALTAPNFHLLHDWGVLEFTR